MAAPDDGTGYSVTPTQRVAFKHVSRKSDDLSSTWQRPTNKSNRSMSGGTSHLGQPAMAKSVAGTGPPGSFSTDILKGSLQSRSTTPQNEQPGPMPRPSLQSTRNGDWADSSEARQAFVRDQIAKELKIRVGTENLLEALMSKNAKQNRDQRAKIEQELGTSNRKIAELRFQLDNELQRAQSPNTPPSRRMSGYFRSSPLRSPRGGETPEPEEADKSDEESPTVVLTDILQALEVEGMPPDYYIERANVLVELFKKHPTLKYDLAWSVFSLRVQLMLLSDSSDVIASGYRLTRHAIADRSSLRTIRSLHTDELIVLSLIKKDKAALEREQAVKLVRAFLDVKSGVYELSMAVVRSLVAVAEQNDDSLKDICLLTLAEILTKHPSLLVTANGMSTLTDALANGTFPAPDGLVASFLHILDHPRQRRYLSTGREFEAMFAPFTDPMLLNGNEEKLKHCAKAIAAMLKTWPGFLALSERNAVSLRSLIESMQYPITAARGIMLDLLIDTLRIKVPFWSDTYVAGRRLTTYGRVNTDIAEPLEKRTITGYHAHGRFDLSYHFSAIVLAVLIRAGLIQALFNLIKTEEDNSLRRRATLVLTEVLRMAQESLPCFISAKIQVLGNLISPVEDFLSQDHAGNMEMLYQIESINRTKNKARRLVSGATHTTDEIPTGGSNRRLKYSPLIDGDQFRLLVAESQVLAHASYLKWKWDIILGLIEGPLTNAKRLEEAIKSSKFLKRLTGFYRPFKHRFSDIRNNQFNQRYVRYGCSLFRTLLQTQVGIQYLSESKVLRQIAECLAQVDPKSGLTSMTPQFDPYQMTETLSGGYFAILGALSSTIEGINIMERWHMMDMFYHILERRDRDDLVRAILGNMDFTLDTHLRVMLSQALTSAFKSIRLFATKLLRRHAVGHLHQTMGVQDASSAHWALRLVMTQLYDPDVEVCETAVKILEEACEQREHLEFVVRCRPALDHLGEIGAPLLLRFLATSVGYRYLNGLDYITQEMDDWFLGRNDSYVALVEASLARAYMDAGVHKTAFSDDPELLEMGLAPAHFYRELARTEEGCKLLRQSGHFYEFSSTLRDFDLEDDDYETLVKVKGSLWAIGNIGSMELGAPFLEQDDVVKSVVRIAEGAAVMSVRGTAVFALGLCSRTLHGVQMLAENGWDTTVDSSGLSLGLCVPRDLDRLCMAQTASTNVPPPLDRRDTERYKGAVVDEDPLKAKVLKLVVNMGNSVTYKKIGQDLQVLRMRQPHLFTDVGLFRKTLVILESHHYRLLARQHILDLFDKSVMRKLVLDEDSSETESDTG